MISCYSELHIANYTVVRNIIEIQIIFYPSIACDITWRTLCISTTPIYDQNVSNLSSILEQAKIDVEDQWGNPFGT